MTPEAFIMESLFRIPNKEGEEVDFKLNEAQRTLDSSLTGRDLVPKARQEGVSTYVIGRFLAKCLRNRNTRAVIISHDRDSTERLFSRARFMLENMKGPKPLMRQDSAHQLSFSKTNSQFFIGTAGSRKFGRGDTITALHCSEYAFWPDPKTLMTGLLQAVPYSGEIIIESTGNGFNDYYQRCQRAEKGQSLWVNHFLPWHTFKEYTLELTPAEEAYLREDLKEDWEEPELVERFNLTMGQIAWRRMKLDELDYDLTKFKQEYPMTLDECFQMSSESIFTVVNYQPTERWIKIDRNFWALEGHPRPDLTYTLGGDVAAGLGGDRDASVVEVFCVDTGDQVAEYISNRVNPIVFAYKLAEIGKVYNTAYAVVEQNNHGILTLEHLQDVYPAERLHKDKRTKTTDEEQRLFKLGHKTNVRNKPLMIGNFRNLVAREWKIHSAILKSEMSTFIEDENGKLGAQEGCHDDTVIAGSCAATGVNKAAMLSPKLNPPVLKRTKDPFMLDNILEELGRSGERWPIRDQSGYIH